MKRSKRQVIANRREQTGPYGKKVKLRGTYTTNRTLSNGFVLHSSHLCAK